MKKDGPNKITLVSELKSYELSIYYDNGKRIKDGNPATNKG
jgi:hypothetical protein